jgi:inorganic pyrophosphatase
MNFMPLMDVIIETPRGSAQKYDYEPGFHCFRLKKMLPSGMVFPYDFGFIPGTKGEDGDPLDVMVISELSSFPGCLIRCRIIGGFEAEQSGKKKKKKMIRNDRYFAVPQCSNTFGKIVSINDLPEKILHELEQFFIDYNRVRGKKFHVLNRISAGKAERLILGGSKE